MSKEDRGFASMDSTRQREISSMGGRAAHLRGTPHEWSIEEAREAGRKGGRRTTESINKKLPRSQSRKINASS